MPFQNTTVGEHTSVVRDWVTHLPLRAQGTLLTCIRGCDLTPKPLLAPGIDPDDVLPERRLTAFLRYCILNPADPREVDIPGAWMRSTPPVHGWKPSQLGHYPLHWYSHLMHTFEVIGYCHPDDVIRCEAHRIYVRLVHALHLVPETKDQMLARLTEDRIAKGEVVS